MKKKVKDLTIEEIKAICKKARTNKKGKIKDYCCRDNCPLGSARDYQLMLDTSPRLCEIVAGLNKEIEVDGDE